MRISVPDPVAQLCRILTDADYEAFMVGGCVRDLAAGLVPNDYDITTNCLPEETMRIFTEKQFSVVPVGIKYGTVAVMVEGVAYEITTYRAEADYTDGRRPDEVHFLKNIEGDLARRDFTINAMAYDPVHHRLTDLFDGIGDMERKIVRAVGDPHARFAEDYLRMLRAVRYAVRFGFEIEPATLSAITAHAPMVARISKERIFAELYKMAGETGADFARGIALLKDTGILHHILPELDVMDQFDHTPATHPEGGVWEHTLAALRMNAEKNATVNLAILFHDIGKPATHSVEGARIRYTRHAEAGHEMIDAIARRLPMPGDLKDALQFAALHHMKFHDLLDMAPHKLIALIEHPQWPVLYTVAWCDAAARGTVDTARWRAIDERVASLREKYIEQRALAAIRAFVNGQLVMQVKNIPPGPQVGAYLEKITAWVLDESIDPADTEKITAYLRSLHL